jgi:galactose mutarotase-like enzyme
VTFRLPFTKKPKPAFPTAADFGYVELRGGGSRAVVIPSLGGKVSELELAGRQWLWTSDILPWKLPEPTATSYVETADTGGYDECFPTVGPCRIPGWIRAYGGLELPDHGELWSQAPTLEIETTQGGQCAVTSWAGVRLPYRLTRIVRVAPDGSVVMEYHAANDGEERLPFIWSAHPLLPLTSSTELKLPEGSELRVYAAHKIALGDHKSQHRWPFVRAAGKQFDFSRPWLVAKQFACKLFVDLPVGQGRAVVREGDVELEATFETNEVGQFGLWINKEGWTPFKRERPYVNLAFEPSIGAPDTLSDALGDWKRAQWLEPGQIRSWSVTWRGRKVEEEEGTGQG